MLTDFRMQRTFHDTIVRLYVDRVRKEANVTITHKRRITAMSTIRYDEVDTVEAAEAWFRKERSEHGNTVEHFDWQCRTGLLGRVHEHA